jgi:predicted dehydrogenase
MSERQRADAGKIVLVGVGYWGSKLLRNLVGLVGSERLVVVDAHLDRLGAACKHYPSVECALDLRAALDDPDVSSVVIATPVETHAELATMALEAGRHVLIEKPMSTAVSDARSLTRLAEERSLVLMVGHTFLFSPRVEWIADRLNREPVGSMHYVTSARLNLGRHRSDANVIWDLAPHDFSIILHLLREDPVTVQTAARCVLRRDLPEVAFIDLTFPSGVIASVNVSWLAPRKVRSLVLVGRSGMIVYDDTDADEPVKVYDKGVLGEDEEGFGEHQLTYRHGDTIAPHIKVREPLAEELEHFLACVDGGVRPRSDGRFGTRVVAALEAADRSWRLGGQPVEVTSTGHGELLHPSVRVPLSGPVEQPAVVLATRRAASQ